MGITEKISQKFLDAVNEMTPDLDDVYKDAHQYTVDGWKTKQTTLVTGSGAASVAIPGWHLVGLIADAAFVVNRMGVSTYGLGAIAGHQAGVGNILEREDFAAVLGYWSDDESIQHAMAGKGAAKLSAKAAVKIGTKVAGKAYLKGVTKVMLSSSGYLIGQKLGGKALAKASAKFAGKYAGKAAGGFVPWLGPLVGGGVNMWLITSIMTAADGFYRDKIALIKGS